MPTLLEVMVDAAGIASRGSQGIVTAGSDTHMLVDASLRNTGIDESHLGGAWILRPSAANASDVQRQLTAKPFRRTIGGLLVNLPWTVAPAAAEVYYMFASTPALYDPSNAVSWQRAVNLGLSKIWFNDTVTATLVSGMTRRFTVAAISGFIPTAQNVKRVIRRTTGTDYTEYDADRNGMWTTQTMDDGVLTIETNFVPGDDIIRVELLRPYSPLAALTDSTTCELHLAALAARWQWEKLMRHKDAEVQKAFADWYAVYGPRAPQYAVRP